MSAIEDITAERERQILTEGWSHDHDDEHADGSLAAAAAAYALPFNDDCGAHDLRVRSIWPQSWSWTWWKPKDRRSDLVRAGALIVAEIERLDRVALLAKDNT